MRVKPTRDNILVLPHVAADTTKGGIFVPQMAKPKAPEGTVMAVGPGRRLKNGLRVPIEVTVGTVVRYDPQQGADIKLNGTEYRIIPEWAIEMVVSE